ncbi:MAG: PspC domain-containing protein [Peptostreptococcaceae bacterium]|nr:PspC domain-containing protein [Peptostreptococcaceae bacterium]
MTLKKRLYKDTENKMLGGVCAGIADYFAIDPTIVRLLWVFFSMFYGIGVLIYIAALIILPNKNEII